MPETQSDTGVAERPRLVTTRYAAEYCGVSTTTIRRWIADGRLQAYRSGPKLLRVDVDAVAALVVPA